MNLTDPGTLAFLGLVLAPVVAGIVQAFRASMIESRWLPLVSAGAGVVVAVLASYVPDNPLSGVALPGAILAGLMVGLGTTGAVTVVTHATTGTTDGQGTMSRTNP